MVPPVELGPIGNIAIPRSNTIGDAYVSEVGAISFTVIVKVVIALPPVFVAVMVYVVAGFNSPGVPAIVPVVESKTNPPGKLGLMA
jgi:hypothetical protein